LTHQWPLVANAKQWHAIYHPFHWSRIFGLAVCAG
jgi:hypothetical protein